MTRLMVLGLLMKGPMSGYDMQQLLQLSKTDAWAGVLPGSIYHALKKMDKEGLVTVDSVEQTGHRTKAIYRITEEGEEQFYQLLQQSLALPSVIFPTTFYTAVSFIDALPKDRIIAAIESQRTALRKQYDEMKAGEEEKSQFVNLTEPAKIIFRNMYDQFEIQLSMLDQLEAAIRSQPD
ncbi:PadR family transcriptional regulator [Paenibacillus sp. MSJ-34]|uniref:PadR family transcriptional regulator n=2 Tax=unclassified Paenibacillus TaxID=185978 RepID=UPI001C0FE3D9|nr:PadR family transcriptional regulator [Paenibacillus sp. MSJ-34]CAH0120778.1 hypothetical protein PAE9249_03300 [Paenibacillus sp. CECT 9249]